MLTELRHPNVVELLEADPDGGSIRTAFCARTTFATTPPASDGCARRHRREPRRRAQRAAPAGLGPWRDLGRSLPRRQHRPHRPVQLRPRSPHLGPEPSGGTRDRNELRSMLADMAGRPRATRSAGRPRRDRSTRSSRHPHWHDAARCSGVHRQTSDRHAGADSNVHLPRRSTDARLTRSRRPRLPRTRRCSSGLLLVDPPARLHVRGPTRRGQPTARWTLSWAARWRCTGSSCRSSAPSLFVPDATAGSASAVDSTPAPLRRIVTGVALAGAVSTDRGTRRHLGPVTCRRRRWRRHASTVVVPPTSPSTTTTTRPTTAAGRPAPPVAVPVAESPPNRRGRRSPSRNRSDGPSLRVTTSGASRSRPSRDLGATPQRRRRPTATGGR